MKYLLIPFLLLTQLAYSDGGTPGEIGKHERAFSNSEGKVSQWAYTVSTYIKTRSVGDDKSLDIIHDAQNEKILEKLNKRTKELFVEWVKKTFNKDLILDDKFLSSLEKVKALGRRYYFYTKKNPSFKKVRVIAGREKYGLVFYRLDIFP